MARKKECVFVAIQAEKLAEELRKTDGCFDEFHGGGDAQESFIVGFQFGVKWQKLRAKIRSHKKRRTTAAQCN